MVDTFIEGEFDCLPSIDQGEILISLHAVSTHFGPDDLELIMEMVSRSESEVIH